jgi:hypothetical protein
MRKDAKKPETTSLDSVTWRRREKKNKKMDSLAIIYIQWCSRASPNTLVETEMSKGNRFTSTTCLSIRKFSIPLFISEILPSMLGR